MPRSSAAHPENREATAEESYRDGLTLAARLSFPAVIVGHQLMSRPRHDRLARHASGRGWPVPSSTSTPYVFHSHGIPCDCRPTAGCYTVSPIPPPPRDLRLVLQLPS